MKEFRAGIIAGAIAGLLSPATFYTVLFLASAGNLDFPGVAQRISDVPWVKGLGMSVEVVLVIIAFGLVLVSLVCSGLGVVLGMLFVKFVNKLPLRSIYLKSLSLGIVVYLLVSLFSFAGRRVFLDITGLYTLVSILVDSFIFSFLFIRWRKPLTDSKPKT